MESLVPDAKWLQEKLKSYITLSEEDAIYFFLFLNIKNLKTRKSYLRLDNPVNISHGSRGMPDELIRR
ncbi:MAG: hypothetical protein R2769_02035 [Saprospiraceae bacterium]